MIEGNDFIPDIRGGRTMGKTYSLKEILEMAIKIEEDGVIFYESLAGRSKNREVIELAKYLAGEEKDHIAVFRSIYKELTGEKFEKAFIEDEANAYLHLLVENRVFKNQEEIKKFVEDIKDDLSILDLAIQIEKDTILYYYEVLEGLEDKEKTLVKELINQEKTHIYRLTNLKNILRG
jgi:rubrerythrin